MFVNIWGKNIWYDIYGAEHSDTLLYLMEARVQAVWIL